MSGRNNVPDYLLTAHDMISEAYPNGLTDMDSDYLTLLFILAERMSHRDVTSTMSPFVGELPGVILNDVYRALSDEMPSDEEISRVRNKLNKSSLKKWAEQWESIADDKDLYKDL